MLLHGLPRLVRVPDVLEHLVRVLALHGEEGAGDDENRVWWLRGGVIRLLDVTDDMRRYDEQCNAHVCECRVSQADVRILNTDNLIRIP